MSLKENDILQQVKNHPYAVLAGLSALASGGIAGLALYHRWREGQQARSQFDPIARAVNELDEGIIQSLPEKEILHRLARNVWRQFESRQGLKFNELAPIINQMDASWPKHADLLTLNDSIANGQVALPPATSKGELRQLITHADYQTANDFRFALVDFHREHLKDQGYFVSPTNLKNSQDREEIWRTMEENWPLAKLCFERHGINPEILRSSGLSPESVLKGTEFAILRKNGKFQGYISYFKTGDITGVDLSALSLSDLRKDSDEKGNVAIVTSLTLAKSAKQPIDAMAGLLYGIKDLVQTGNSSRILVPAVPYSIKNMKDPSQFESAWNPSDPIFGSLLWFANQKEYNPKFMKFELTTQDLLRTTHVAADRRTQILQSNYARNDVDLVIGLSEWMGRAKPGDQYPDRQLPMPIVKTKNGTYEMTIPAGWMEFRSINILEASSIHNSLLMS